MGGGAQWSDIVHGMAEVHGGLADLSGMAKVHGGLADLIGMAEVHGGLADLNGMAEVHGGWRCTVVWQSSWNGGGAKRERCKVVVKGKGASPRSHGPSERSRGWKNAGQMEEGQARG